MYDWTPENVDVSGIENRLLNAFGLAIQGEAVTRAPVDTGNLRNSINFKVSGDTVRVGSSVEYALVQENREGFLAAGLDKAQAQAGSIIRRAE